MGGEAAGHKQKCLKTSKKNTKYCRTCTCRGLASKGTGNSKDSAVDKRMVWCELGNKSKIVQSGPFIK